MTYTPEYPRLHFAKGAFTLLLSLVLLTHFALNGLPQSSPHPNGLVGLVLFTALASIGICIHGYRAYQAQNNNESDD